MPGGGARGQNLVHLQKVHKHSRGPDPRCALNSVLEAQNGIQVSSVCHTHSSMHTPMPTHRHTHTRAGRGPDLQCQFYRPNTVYTSSLYTTRTQACRHLYPPHTHIHTQTQTRAKDLTSMQAPIPPPPPYTHTNDVELRT